MYFIYIVYDSILGTKGKGKVEKAFMVFQGATIGKGTKCNNNSCTVRNNYSKGMDVMYYELWGVDMCAGIEVYAVIWLYGDACVTSSRERRRRRPSVDVAT